MGTATIGVASRQTGVHIETIRYYERIGLLPEPTRGPGGQRQYGEALIRRLCFVRRTRELGFTLKEVRDLLGLVDGGHYSCAEVRTLTLDHLQAVRRRITDLERLAAVLEELAGRCEGGPAPACPIIETLFREPA